MSDARFTWLSIAAVCIVLATSSSGCSKQSSDTKAQDLGRQPTVGDYIKQHGITEAQVKPGDPNAPTITLPALPGWQDAGA